MILFTAATKRNTVTLLDISFDELRISEECGVLVVVEISKRLEGMSRMLAPDVINNCYESKRHKMLLKITVIFEWSLLFVVCSS